jgi:mono/diheme cytochrome c family protein
MDGEALYRAYCAACHGLDALGRGPAAPALKTTPSDLTSIAWRNGGTFPRERLVQYIMNGKPLITAHGSAEMPVWGPNLTALSPPQAKPINERVEAIVAYLRTLQKRR